MGYCNSQRVLVALVIVLSVVIAILVGVLIWRETREEEKAELTSENIMKAYPSYFRTDEEQQIFEQTFLEGIENRFTVLNVTAPLNETCAFNCFGGEFPARRRRQAGGGVLHGCCQSTVKFSFPNQKNNILGDRRILLQLKDAKQFFAEHQCKSVAGCTGCTCQQENEAHTAVVIKSHIGNVNKAKMTSLLTFLLVREYSTLGYVTFAIISQGGRWFF
ncbi:uncharacterized protein LOC123537982 [Mercenaria mercenaria]|uniref:uncharacterized protein LOC123537982 n=1 Tax=Mercenaria mercenaria TaxID=6596 RepID=UPI00234E83F2|nr:uncharacterized protein LOC123537982 [Mercenaria mercenaria]